MVTGANKIFSIGNEPYTPYITPIKTNYGQPAQRIAQTGGANYGQYDGKTQPNYAQYDVYKSPVTKGSGIGDGFDMKM